jgi:hypothetical protein
MDRSAANRNRDINAAFVTSCAITFEAIRLASGGMPALRPLALLIGAKPSLLEEMGQLCAGKHPASAHLNRARNQLGFHWDRALIEPAVRDFATNRSIVWLESDEHSHPVHALAQAVLLHAFCYLRSCSSTPGCKKDIGSAAPLVWASSWTS